MQEEKDKKRRKTEEEAVPIERALELTLRKIRAREKPERRLDSFAMLCEGGMTCAAVAILNNNLFVTTNAIHSNCYRDHRKQIGLVFLQNILGYFQKVATSKQRDKAIEIKLLTYIYCAAWQSENKKNVQSNPNINEKILFEIISYLISNQVSDWIQKDITFFTQFLPENDKLLFQAARNKWNKKNIDLISNTLSDIRQVIGFVSPYVRHLKKVVHMLITTNVLNDFNILAIGKPDEHAEIRLLGYLLDVGVLQRIAQTKIDDKHYIGISKLCCCHCAKVFEIINTVIHHYSPKSDLNLELPDSKSLSSENISEEIQQLVEHLDEDDFEPIRTGGSHGLLVKNWKSPSYAEGESYINKGGKDGDLPGFVWTARTNNWVELEFHENDCTTELRDKIKSEFIVGLRNLNTILEKRKKILKENPVKPLNDDDRLQSFISQHFRVSVSMWQEASTSSEEDISRIKAQLLIPSIFNDQLLDEYDHDDINTLLSADNVIKLSGCSIPENITVMPLSALQNFKNREMTTVNLLIDHLREIVSNVPRYKPNHIIILPCQMARHFFVVAVLYTGNQFVSWYIHSVNQPLMDEFPQHSNSPPMAITYGDDDVIKCLRQELSSTLSPDINLHIIRLNQQTAITKLCGGITVQNAIDLITGKVNLLELNPEAKFTIQDPSQAYDIIDRQRRLLKPDDLGTLQFN